MSYIVYYDSQIIGASCALRQRKRGCRTIASKRIVCCDCSCYVAWFLTNISHLYFSLYSYTLSGTTSLVFNVAPADADEIYVINPTQVESIARAGDLSSGAITGQTEETSSEDNDVILMFDTSASALRKITKTNFSPSLTYTAGAAVGDGSTVAFTINSGRAVANVLVIVNGVVLVPTTDYTISGTTLTFATAPAGAAEIEVRYLPITT